MIIIISGIAVDIYEDIDSDVRYAMAYSVTHNFTIFMIFDVTIVVFNIYYSNKRYWQIIYQNDF